MDTRHQAKYDCSIWAKYKIDITSRLRIISIFTYHLLEFRFVQCEKKKKLAAPNNLNANSFSTGLWSPRSISAWWRCERDWESERGGGPRAPGGRQMRTEEKETCWCFLPGRNRVWMGLCWWAFCALSNEVLLAQKYRTEYREVSNWVSRIKSFIFKL